ncbi:2-keto-3-deoxy-phosphogalactonate aldolase [Faunimonas pinastri]|uniref:2-keto-3-deoxy-phosphogalactonate aldolase n=1 Tax=Faunimonas pinastri TaxID=1855383 RepID=A0A1H9NRI1_9HYPH|nr:2-dehydro-3-deoxy-6-phosphogalactonate aldolase [Faunimonas pinastri]SER38644.1 2-keto-3-deoxy-phosphogalactonate aldolase [Faunimonas pinastri]
MNERLSAAMSVLPLVAILRGLKPTEAEGIAASLVEAGFSIIEVPMNSPEPLKSIEIIRKSVPAEVVVGAGTVLEPAWVDDIANAGGEIIIMPHADTKVISTAHNKGMACVPGVSTPTEAFAALAAGADALKAFPAELIPPAGIKAWRAILPKGTELLPVGGITPDNMTPYVDAGVAGFGLGSALYKPGMNAADVARTAGAFVASWRSLKNAA